MRMHSTKRVWLYYFAVLVIWLTAVVARLKINGLVYNLDFGLFQPDGLYYSFKTLEFLGWSDKSALTEITQWYQANSAKFQALDLVSFNDPTSNPWIVTKFRFLYPLLSVPFVYLFGLSGMLVVPALSLLCFFLFIQKIAILHKVPTVGTLLILLLTTSTTLLRWTTVNYSDGLILALFSLFAYLVLVSEDIWSEKSLILLSIIVSLTAFTRQMLPIWLVIGVFFLYTKKLSPGIVTIFTALITSIPSILSFPYAQFFAAKQDENFLQSFLGFFSNAIYINLIEIVQLIVLDRTLLIILLISFYCTLKFRDEIFTHIFLLTTFGAVLINSLVGVSGVNFRYFLPILPFATLMILRTNFVTSIEELLSKSQPKH